VNLPGREGKGFGSRRSLRLLRGCSLGRERERDPHPSAGKTPSDLTINGAYLRERISIAQVRELRIVSFPDPVSYLCAIHRNHRFFCRAKETTGKRSEGANVSDV